MPLIPAKPSVGQKDTLSLRLDRAVHERLRQYATFIQSPKDYIVGQALRRLFRKDHEFAAWLKTQPAAAVDGRLTEELAEEAVIPTDTSGRTRAERRL